jgi:hypothetical protein
MNSPIFFLSGGSRQHKSSVKDQKFYWNLIEKRECKTFENVRLRLKNKGFAGCYTGDEPV